VPAGTQAPPDGLSSSARAAFRAVLRLGSRARPWAGGVEVRAGIVPLALDEAVWCPDPDRLDELADGSGPVGAILPTGAPSETAARAAGFVPALGVATDDPTATDAALPSADGDDVGWDGAREVARVLAADLGAPEVTDALATALASAAAADPAVRLVLGPGSPAAAALVVVEDDAELVVVLAGGDAEALAARALAEGRALGKRTVWTRVRPHDADDAGLRRWERTPSSSQEVPQ
jgi:hypothetical protein